MALLSQREIDDVRRRIKVSRKAAREKYHGPLQRARDLYSGEHYPKGRGPRAHDQIVINYLWAITETKVAALALNMADFLVRPLREDFLDRTRLVSEVLTWTWRQNRSQQEAKRALRDCMIGGLGIVSTGWLLVETDARGRTVTEHKGRRPEVLGEEPDPTENDPEGALPPLQVPETRIRKNRPYATRIAPGNFWVAPETGAVIEDAMWCGWTERVPVERVKRNRAYSHTSKLQGTAEGLVELDEELRDKREDAPEDIRRVELHHYWEEERRIHAVFAEESEDPLLIEPWPHPYDRYPVQVLRVPDDEDCFFPTPPLVRLEHPQREINLARTMLALHMRQSTRKYQRIGGKLSNANKEQFSSPKLLALVELEDGNPITEIPHAPVQMEVFQSMQAAREDLQVLAAMNEYEAFAPPTKRTTQAEVAAIQAAGGARAQATRADFEAFLSGIARDQLALLQQYSVGTQNFALFGPGGQESRWGHYTREEIGGDYLVEVYVGSTQAPNRKSIQEQLGFLLQSLTNAVQAIIAGQQVGMNVKLLVKQLLETIPEIRDVEQIFQPDPQAQMMLPGGMPGMETPEPGMEESPETNPLADLLGQVPPEDLEALLAYAGANGTSGF